MHVSYGRTLANPDWALFMMLCDRLGQTLNMHLEYARKKIPLLQIKLLVKSVKKPIGISGGK